MLAARVRSGLVETVHDGAVAVVSANGNLIAAAGDIDRPFFSRSSAKPFQAAVAEKNGAGLRPIELALAAASHSGDPVHVSIVDGMLKTAGLDESHLRCPPAWPLGETAMRNRLAAGHVSGRALWNNCSGKHAAWLRASVANGWPTDDYLDPGHPLQGLIAAQLSAWGAYDVSPVGVDGCGAPTMRTTALAMATLFARLATEEDLAGVYQVMHRYPALVSGTQFGDAAIATAIDAAAKGGAEGCLGVAIANGLGVAVKSWDGSRAVAEVAAIATLDSLGLLGATAKTSLQSFSRPPIMGGGLEVGALESRLDLAH